jgi:hypothetical protein
MAGTQNGQAPYLTTNNGVYYIDTDSQDLSCIHAGGWQTPGFQQGQTYVIWNLFAAKDTRLTYQMYVGANFNPATDGRWVRVQPHVFHAVDTGGGNNLIVKDCTNCGGLPAHTVANGVLTVSLTTALSLVISTLPAVLPTRSACRAIFAKSTRRLTTSVSCRIKHISPTASRKTLPTSAVL